ncbi:MAG: ATP-dependent zinc metalloprotease FtsH [Cyclobacteriaceae bacterium]
MAERQKSNKDKHQQPDPSQRGINWGRMLIFGLLLLAAFYFFGSGAGDTEPINWNRLSDDYIKEGKVERIEVVNQREALIYLKDTTDTEEGEETFFNRNANRPAFSYTLGSVETFEKKLEEARTEAEAPSFPVNYEYRSDWLGSLLPWLLPLALIIGFWYLMRSRAKKAMGGGSGNPFFSMGKSKAKIYDQENGPGVKFEDIAGLDEAKTEIEELVHYLRDTEKYVKVGAKIPKGVLLVGPPGTGKTMMAKAVAGEANVPFFSLAGSDFVEMFVGVGASRVRDLFKKAQEKSPCIIFIDEIDAIGKARGRAKSMQSNDEQENTLNQLLQALDGFDPNSGVIVLAATNRKDVLDKALLRPGRFDREIYLDLPNRTEREAIYKVHMKNINIKEDIDVRTLAAQSAGFSGAEIANVCNEAALIAARNEREAITQDDFMNAMDRIVAGLEKKTKIISDSEKNIIAYHEAGHAVASFKLENVDSLVKVSIIPRGRSLGANWYLPKERQIITRSQLLDQMCAALAGRAAEEVVFGEISSGALDDLEKVTKMAYGMVTQYGLGEETGNISFYDSSGQSQQSLQKPYSDELGNRMDREVQEILEGAYQRAKDILTGNREALDEIAHLLLDKEVIFNKDVKNVMEEKTRTHA